MSSSSSQPLPSLRPGIYPFWFWNGHLSEGEILWQISQMAEQGIRGFFIHPRQGLQQPYLSKAFFRMVELAISAAERHGLVVHLYDEFPYPSGVAGGEVILGNPQFYATTLIQGTVDIPGGQTHVLLPEGMVLNCSAYPINDGQIDWTQPIDLREDMGIVLTQNSYNEVGLTRYNRTRYFASDPTMAVSVHLPEGRYRIFYSVQSVVVQHKYWGNFVDVLNPDAVAHFLNLTHDRYAAHVGDKFGISVYSIFTDETTPDWSERIPETFYREYGYDLLPLLPALQDESHPRHIEVLSDLYRLKYQMFCETFEAPIAQWCATNGIRYAGEKPSLRLSQLRYMDIPGCEPGHTKVGVPMDVMSRTIRGNARATASGAYFYGKEGALCECYHSLGWSATLSDAKLIADGLLLMGISYLVPHGFFYTTHALTKHDAPPSFFFQMPYWKLFGHLSTHIDRLASYLNGTYIDAEILVVEPASGIPTSAQLNSYQMILDTLMESHLDFLMVDTDILESGRIIDGGVAIRDIVARVVIVPPMRFIESPLQTWLARFESAGGHAIRITHPFHREALIEQLAGIVQPRLRLSVPDGEVRRVQVVTRAYEGGIRWFIVNTSGQKYELRVDAGIPLREIPLAELPPSLTRMEGTAYKRSLYPFESILLDSRVDEMASDPLPRIPISLPPDVQLKPLNPNVLRMYDWNMTLTSADGVNIQTATVPAVPLANQLDVGKFQITPKIDMFFGSSPRLSCPMLSILYQHNFDNQYEGDVELIIEPGSIVGEWTIHINDLHTIHPADFIPEDVHMRGSLSRNITSYLRKGSNSIVVEVETDRLDGGLLNALYLAGDFGVELNPVCLVKQESSGRFEAWEQNGLPYYAGIIDYQTRVTLETLPAAETVILELEFPVPFQSSCEVSCNENVPHAVLWSPYHLVVPTDELQVGANQLRLRVYTSLERCFEGQYFDIPQHRYRSV